MEIKQKISASAAALVAIGFASILGQIVLLRELNVAFYGVELIYLLALGIWLLWSAVGAICGRWLFRSMRSPHLNILFILLAFILPLDIAFIRAVRPLFKAVPGAFLPLTTQLSAMTLAALPIGILLGMMFVLAARYYIADGHSLAKAYALECLGGVIGGLLGTLLLHFSISNLVAGMTCCLLTIIILFYYFNKVERIISSLIVSILLLSIIGGESIDKSTTRWTHPNLVVVKDTPYCRIAVDTLAGQIALFENDALAYDNESAAAEIFVHLSTLQHPNPQRILILGGGLFGLVDEALKHRPQKIVYVELDRVFLDIAQPILQIDRTGFWDYSIVQIFTADPRKFLYSNRASPYIPLSQAETLSTPSPLAGGNMGRDISDTLIPSEFDLILLGMPEPSSGQANRYYTEEFFRLCSQRLSKGGILAFRLRSAENLWTGQMLQRAGSIYRALTKVFADVVILPGTTNVITAAPNLLLQTPEVLVNRLLQRNIEARSINSELINYLYTNDRFRQINTEIAFIAAPVNTDAHPICYQLTTLIWLSQFLPQLFKVNTTIVFDRIDWIWFGLGLTVVLFMLRFARISPFIIVGLAGLIGMLLESALLLGYQIKQGILYQDIGILLSAFMLGMTAGAYTAPHLRLFSHSINSVRKRESNYSKLIFLLILTTLAVFAFGSQLLLKTNWLSNLLCFGAGMFLSGFLTAAIFALVSASQPESPKKIISPLYASDLIGGCVGIVAGSIFFVPFLGLSATLKIAAILALAGLILV